MLLSASFFQHLLTCGVGDAAAIYASGGTWMGPLPERWSTGSGGRWGTGTDNGEAVLSASSSALPMTVNRGAFTSPVGVAQEAHLTALIPVDGSKTGDPMDYPSTRRAQIIIRISAPGASSIRWDYHPDEAFFIGSTGTVQGDTAEVSEWGWSALFEPGLLLPIEIYPVYPNPSPSSAGHQVTVEAEVRYGQNAQPPGYVTPTTETANVHVAEIEPLSFAVREGQTSATGVLVPRNDDYDEGRTDASGAPLADHQRDAQGGHAMAAEDGDLIEGEMVLAGSGEGLVTVSAQTATGNASEAVEVWGQLPGTAGWTLLTDGLADVPVTMPVTIPVKLEGIATSGGPGDARVLAVLKPAQGATAPISTRTEAATVWRIESVEWEATAGNSDLTPNAHPALPDGVPAPSDGDAGLQIFPDKIGPEDAASGRSLVRAKVAIQPPIEGVSIPLEWRDPDDPSSDHADLDKNGAAGDDNRRTEGTGLHGTIFFQKRTSVETDLLGRASKLFTVSMRAGDNYRLIAAHSEAELDDVSDAMVSDPGNNPIQSTARMSRMLTVWRRLWLEQDSMRRPGTGEVTYASSDPVKSITAGGGPAGYTAP